MNRAAFLVAAALACALAGYVAAAPHLFADARAPLIVGAAGAGVGIFVGCARSRRSLGRVDPFDPAVFPLGYIAFSFLAPCWAFFADHKELLGFTSETMHPNTPYLMAAATLAVTLGVHCARRPSFVSDDDQARPPDPHILMSVGRALLVGAVLIGVFNLARGGAAVRHLDQTQTTGLDTLQAALQIALPLGVVLVLVGRRHAESSGLLSSADWLLIITNMALLALFGGRASLIAIMLCVLYAHTRARGGIRTTAIGLGVALILSAAVLWHRATAVGGHRHSVVDSILIDLSPATYSTGITARALSGTDAMRFGSTYFDAIARQVPPPFNNWFVGKGETGTMAFREMIGANNPDQGWGYSVPAEGYLNFGIVGLVGVCLILGMVLGNLYRRRAWPSFTAPGLLYPLVLAATPIAIRSDSVGLIKSGLYPLVAAGLIFAVARSQSGKTQGAIRPVSVRSTRAT